MFFTMTICAGVSIIIINWGISESGKDILKELMQPVLFILLGPYFSLPYVKKLKEELRSKKPE